MSGKQQHYIPVFFQKGWAANTGKKRRGKVHSYEKDKTFPTSIEGNFVENYFHSNEEDTETDDFITEQVETKNLETFKRLHAHFFENKSLIEIKEDDFIQEIDYFILTMYINTASMRQRLFIFLNDFVKTTNIKSIIDEKDFVNIINNSIDYIDFDDKEEATKDFQTIFKNEKETKHQYNTIALILEALFQIYSFDEFYSLIKNISMKDTQRFFHSEIIMDFKKSNKFNNKKYFIVESPTELILSDNLMVYEKDKEFMSFTNGDFEKLYFPISSNKTLLVTNGDTSIPENINEILASCSFKRFSSLNNNFEHLKKHIGENQYFMDELNSETIKIGDNKEEIIELFNSIKLDKEDFKFMNDFINALKNIDILK
jgi:hypothetical protein